MLPRHCPLLLLLALGVAGCSRGPFPVRGVVIIEGAKGPAAELKGYVVALQSEAEPTGASGVIDETGSFQLTTRKAGDGAMPGKYQVAIAAPSRADPDAPEPAPLLERKYSRFETSGLEVDITPGRNELRLTVRRAQP
jgi:hypothetical protein